MLYLVPPEDLSSVLDGEPSFRADQLREWLYDHPVTDTSAMTNLPTDLRERLAPDLWPFTVETTQRSDSGATVKWLFRTPDGMAVEAVLMGYPNRTTLCLSSQAGCALGCTFCATGQFGFDRHLDAGEITAQVAFAQAHLGSEGLPGSPDHLTNIVYMGMGEPLANYRHVRESLRRIIEVMGMGARSVTVSTVGMVPGIRRLADEPWQVNLAVSLHAADDVALAQERRERVGELRVDALVALEVGAVEVDEVEPVVQQRPEHAVREAGIVLAVILLGQRQCHRAHARRHPERDDGLQGWDRLRLGEAARVREGAGRHPLTDGAGE